MYPSPDSSALDHLRSFWYCGIAENLGLHGRDFSRVNALERADVTLLRCFVSYMRSHNAQLKLLEAASGSLKFNFLDLAAACTYDCGICNADCYLSTVRNMLCGKGACIEQYCCVPYIPF